MPGIVGVVVVTFLLNRALPGDPAAFFAGPAATQQAIEEIRVKLGLDKSLPEQFVLYVRDLTRGDLGRSLTTGQPVRADLLARLPASLELTVCGLVFAVAVSLPLGMLAATRPGSWVDHLSRVLDHRRRVAADLLHRAPARLRLLLSARLGPGAARPARRRLFAARRDHRLLDRSTPRLPATGRSSPRCWRNSRCLR